MKTIKTALFCALTALAVYSFTNTNERLARPELVLGKPVFLYSKPLDKYTVVGDVSQYNGFMSFGKEDAQFLYRRVFYMVEKANKLNVDYDALLVDTPANKAILIKF